jgi:hypothetical protein
MAAEEGCHDLRSGAGADLGAVFVVGDVTDPLGSIRRSAQGGCAEAASALNALTEGSAEVDEAQPPRPQSEPDEPT